MTVRNGVNFVVSLRDGISIDDVAKEVGDVLGVPLRASDERGLQDDYVGELVGLRLWLRISDAPTREAPHRIALLGEPEDAFDKDTMWVDIGPYIAELLAARTGRAWTAVSS